MRTDIRHAGGNVLDEQAVTEQHLTSSRWPGDLPAFCKPIVHQVTTPLREASTTAR